MLLIVWDTVRAENLSLHGYGRPTTPNLERLAARGVRFEHAFATSPWTLPSHASLFTGRWPHELSAGWKTPLDDDPPHARRDGSARSAMTPPGSSPTWTTAAARPAWPGASRTTRITRSSVWEVFTRYVGLGRKVDQISLAMVADILAGRRRGGARPLIPLSKEHAKGAADVDRAFLDWLSWQRTRGRPFFAFLNYNDAHSPYQVPDDSAPGFGLRPSSWHDRLVLQQWNIARQVEAALPRRADGQRPL